MSVIVPGEQKLSFSKRRGSNRNSFFAIYAKIDEEAVSAAEAENSFPKFFLYYLFTIIKAASLVFIKLKLAFCNNSANSSI